jgi:hypothetical protein
MGDLVKLGPERTRRARHRLGIARDGARTALDVELRQIDAAIDALKRRRRGVLARYRAELAREIRRASR